MEVKNETTNEPEVVVAMPESLRSDENDNLDKAFQLYVQQTKAEESSSRSLSSEDKSKAIFKKFLLCDKKILIPLITNNHVFIVI